jgi:hypothetical protein
VTRPPRARLALEALADRSLPATVSLRAGVLAVSNPTVVAGATSVTLSQIAADTFAVFDGGGIGVVYDGVRSIRYTGAPDDANDTVTLRLNGLPYAGSAVFQTGAGNDVVEVRGDGGSIGKGLTVNTGAGNDNVRLNSDPVTGGGFVLGAVRVTDPAGDDAATLGNAWTPSLFLGDVRLAGMNTIFLAFGQPDVFRNLTATVVGDATPLDFQTTNTPTVVSVFGNLRLTGGPGDDSVVDSSLLVTGNVAVNLGRTATAGGNDVSLWPSRPALRVNGNYTYTGGPGSDELYLSGHQVGGDMTLNLGGGPDTVDLSTLTSGTQPRVRGDLTIRGGDGTVNFEGILLDGVTVAVSGDFTVALGNGPQLMRVLTAPHGVFRWASGAGDDTLALVPTAGGQHWDVRARFGPGDDTLTLGGAGAGQTLAGWADLGGQVAGDTFTQGANWAPDPRFVVSNVP